jgi:hypothetical protein
MPCCCITPSPCCWHLLAVLHTAPGGPLPTAAAAVCCCVGLAQDHLKAVAAGEAVKGGAQRLDTHDTQTQGGRSSGVSEWQAVCVGLPLCLPVRCVTSALHKPQVVKAEHSSSNNSTPSLPPHPTPTTPAFLQNNLAAPPPPSHPRGPQVSPVQALGGRTA